jgi:starch phosphorylase
MSLIQTYQILPTIPESLCFLEVLARNLWWSWKYDAKELFRRIDPKLWDSADRNPIVFLNRISQERLEAVARDDSFLAHMNRVKDHYTYRVTKPLDRADNHFKPGETVAYFSMEFGIHESLPLFAGGLGVLAGDHLKASSNMALPLTGVGLLYRQGYFRQYLDHSGWQQEEYPEVDLFHLPLERVHDAQGKQLQVSVHGPDGPIHADVWQVHVGRICLLLLDTNIAANPPAIRETTARLYAAEGRLRLAQEVLLGIGGMRVLQALDIYPKVCHMNEGHSAFSGIQRLAFFMARYGVDLQTAMEIVPRTTVFTTHTPVAAGHDEFPAETVRPYLAPFQESLGTTVDQIVSWGQGEGAGANSPFSMFVLGLRLSGACNGVSALHGRVARRMWAHIWPERPEDEIPISHVTNGVHISSFISPTFAYIFERSLGPEWYMCSRRPENAARIESIYDEEIWQAHERNRARLIRTCRQQMRQQYSRRNAPAATIEEADTVLDQDILTIGFARRFATYKRGTLLLSDPERLKAIINSPKYPVQFIFAGKAHPRDNEGKQLIQRLVEFGRNPEVRHRFIFIEDYDMRIARHMVQGCDVWLNNPRRPFEACGTSGMKAAVNGVLNVSILDGWWDEAYTENCGWAIGQGEEYDDPQYQDAVESQALYNVLENEVIPCFYDRRNGEAPTCWVKTMKASMKMAMERFCSLHMVAEYETRFYAPAAHHHDELIADGAGMAKQLAAQSARLKALWAGIRIYPPVKGGENIFRVGDRFSATVEVELGQLLPDEVDVELYYGPLKEVDSFHSGTTLPMAVVEDLGNSRYRYHCSVDCRQSGRYGLTARVTPRGDERLKFASKLITWA